MRSDKATIEDAVDILLFAIAEDFGENARESTSPGLFREAHVRRLLPTVVLGRTGGVRA